MLTRVTITYQIEAENQMLLDEAVMALARIEQAQTKSINSITFNLHAVKSDVFVPLLSAYITDWHPIDRRLISIISEFTSLPEVKTQGFGPEAYFYKLGAQARKLGFSGIKEYELAEGRTKEEIIKFCEEAGV